MNVLTLDPGRRCKLVREWPEEDQACRSRALVGGNVIDEDGSLVHYATTSLRRLDSAYGRWLQWLDMRGELDPAVPPAARITRQRAADYTRDLLRLNGTRTVMERIESLYYMCRALDPQHPLPWLLRVVAAVRTRNVPVRIKESRIVDSDELYQLGLRLMERARKLSSACASRRALRYRNGLIISLLACCPLRRLDLSMLHIGDNFIRRGDEWWIDMPASKTRSHGTLLVFPLTTDLTASVDEYLSCYRPLLLAMRRRGYPSKHAGDALWIGQDGSAMSYPSFYQIVVRETCVAFGRPINPHQFRHCAATSVSTHDPHHVRIIGPILGHTSQSTSERYYNMARSFQAARPWQENILRLRERAIRKQNDDTEC